MYEKLSKGARDCMMVNECIAGAIVTVILAIVWLCIRNVDMMISPNWIWLLVVIVWILSLTAPFVRYERYRYRFTDEEIDVKEGFIFVERNIVPIERLHKISMASGPVDRCFGLAKVIVTTAGGDVTIRFLQTEVAEEIVNNLKKRINECAIEERELEKESTDK